MPRDRRRLPPSLHQVRPLANPSPASYTTGGSSCGVANAGGVGEVLIQIFGPTGDTGPRRRGTRLLGAAGRTRPTMATTCTGVQVGGARAPLLPAPAQRLHRSIHHTCSCKKFSLVNGVMFTGGSVKRGIYGPFLAGEGVRVERGGGAKVWQAMAVLLERQAVTRMGRPNP